MIQETSLDHIQSTEIAGLKVHTYRKFADDRGYFVERYNRQRFIEWELPTEYYQDNHSVSHPGVLRGLHFQIAPAQGKLVTCLSGRVLDVVVDLRLNSPTFGKNFAVELSENNTRVFWIPPGFAHGFCVLGNQPAHLLYKVTSTWNASSELTLKFNDPTLNINWPASDFIMSPKDHQGITLQEYRERFSKEPAWWL